MVLALYGAGGFGKETFDMVSIHMKDKWEEVNFIDVKIENAPLEGKVFVITGSLNKFNNRDELINFIDEKGGKVISAISSKVNYLINNDVNSTSTKNKKARELGIKIISEDEFMELAN